MWSNLHKMVNACAIQQQEQEQGYQVAIEPKRDEPMEMNGICLYLSISLSIHRQGSLVFWGRKSKQVSAGDGGGGGGSSSGE